MKIHPRFVSFALLAFAGTVAFSAPAAPRSLKILMITGGSSHDYTAQKKIISEGIAVRANVTFDIVQEGTTRDHKLGLYLDPHWADGYDAVIHDECFGFVEDVAFVESVVAIHKAGLPAVMLHCSSHSYRNAKTDEWRKLVGITSMRHDTRRDIEVKNVSPGNPVMKTFPAQWHDAGDELYNNVQIWPNAIPLATAHSIESDKDHVVAWLNTYEKSRVFSTTMGHTNATVSDPVYLDLLTRGLLWVCGKLDDKGNPLPGYEAPAVKHSD